MQTESPASPRLVRVFVSSTFRDMQDERDVLVKHVFPQLRQRCRERGVEFVEVDLRWGITEEQAMHGQVLPLCLAEIENCRPYFIGLIGERYGWVPDHIPEELVEVQPWLAEHCERSVTELEILHGVLNEPEMAQRSFFYFRDPAYLDRIPAEQRADFQSKDVKNQEKLKALKAHIRDTGLPLVDGYPDPETVGQQILDDLWMAIDHEFPAGSEPEPLNREAAAHQAFAESRARVYVGRREYFERIDRHVNSIEPPLVLLGESGSGKSALLANWARRFHHAHPDDFLLLHFIGSTPQSADWAPMLRRIMGEFKRCFDIREQVPDQPDALRSAFANWLHMAAARGRVVLILDALNQLEDREGALDLAWLPPEIPSNVRLLLSTLPGRPLDELTKRGWPTLRVEPLSPAERRQLIEGYLAQYVKALSPPRVERIAGAEQTANPLYLRALLEELRIFGIHEQLDQRIDHYLAARTVDDLYEKILQRYEQDYETSRPGLVRDAMSLLWAARRGLGESEILELLGNSDNPLPRAVWSPLYLAAQESLVSRSGLLTFFHNYLRQAVRDRYLPSEAERQAAHLRVADYFVTRDLDARKIAELPWQLAQARAWERLYDLLADLPFFAAAWKTDRFEVKAYWSQVEESSPLRMVAAYRPVLDAPARHSDYVWHAAWLLYDTGHPVEALQLYEFLGERCRQSGDMAGLASSLGNQAVILYDRGDLDAALMLHKAGERIYRELGDEDGLQHSLGNQALILHDRGDVDGAIALHREEERLCRKSGDRDGLQRSLGNQALVLRNRGDLDEAMALLEEQARICRELGNKDGLANSLGNQAPILQARGDLDEAMALYREAERICREMGNKEGLASTLGNQGILLKRRGDLDGAMTLYREVENICREIGNKDGLASVFGNQALILRARGDLDGAMALLKEQERICREMPQKHGLQLSLGNQALILCARGKLDGAMALLKEQERICREIDDKDGLQRSLGNQANILADLGDFGKALALHQEKERICRELGTPRGLALSLANQAVVLARLGRPRQALPPAEEAYRLATSYGLTRVMGQVKPILDAVRSMLE